MKARKTTRKVDEVRAEVCAHLRALESQGLRLALEHVQNAAFAAVARTAILKMREEEDAADERARTHAREAKTARRRAPGRKATASRSRTSAKTSA